VGCGDTCDKLMCDGASGDAGGVLYTARGTVIEMGTVTAFFSAAGVAGGVMGAAGTVVVVCVVTVGPAGEPILSSCEIHPPRCDNRRADTWISTPGHPDTNLDTSFAQCVNPDLNFS